MNKYDGTGKCCCSVIDCPQSVYPPAEAAKKYPMCYAHSKMRDGLFVDPWRYESDFRFEKIYPLWDLVVKE